MGGDWWRWQAMAGDGRRWEAMGGDGGGGGDGDGSDGKRGKAICSDRRQWEQMGGVEGRWEAMGGDGRRWEDDYSNKKNYRPVSLLPIVSKVFERLLSNNIYSYIEKYLSTRLCGFRKDHSTQLSLIIMLEEIRKNLDKGRFSGMLLTDLSKAFDCLVHDLLIAKLNAYGFGYNALSLINNYFSNRKQRTKIGEAFSKWSRIIIGVLQGSIPWPLLFNIYINDIFLMQLLLQMIQTIMRLVRAILLLIWLFQDLKKIQAI